MWLIHHRGTPVKDRNRAGRLKVIPIDPEHHGLGLDVLLAMEAYRAPGLSPRSLYRATQP